MIRNLHWYNTNTTRDYPLADNASGSDHNSIRLPTHIIADLNLRFPDTYGAVAFVSAVTVTPHLVSVVIQAAADTSDTTSFLPLAVINIPQPVTPWRHYALDAQADGVGGWIVFGEGITESYSGRFTVTGGLLASRAARSYTPLPVTSVSKLYSAERLSGLVKLRAEAPLELVGETREIEGVLRTVGVLRLVQSADNLNTNVFEEFSGPCGARAETGNCGNPVPIEYLNAVQADCNGNLTIAFSGCARLGVLENGNGVVLDCGLGLIDACIADKLPTSDGILSNEYTEQCEPSWYSEYISDYAMPSEEIGDLSAASELLLGGGMTWPLWYTFDLGVANEWKVVSGFVGFGGDGNYSWQPVLGSTGAYTGQQAAYIATDTTTLGSWLGRYGAAGYAIPGTTVLESFAAGLFTANIFAGTCTGLVNNTYESLPVTTSRALQIPPSGTTRTASYWTNDPGAGDPDSFDFDLKFVDAQQHDVSLYFMSYDGTARSQTVEILDYFTPSVVLYSHTLTNFHSGVWLHYRLKGGIKIRVTRVSGPDAILSAVLLDQHIAYSYRSLSSFENNGVRIGHISSDNLVLHQLAGGAVTVGRTLSCATMVVVGGDTYKAEVVLNYHTSSSTGQPSYYAAVIDTATNTFSIRKTDGTTETVKDTLTDAVNVVNSFAIELLIEIVDAGGGSTTITVTGWKLTGNGPIGSVFDSGASYNEIGSVATTVTDYVDTGRVGFRANKSAARLLWFWGELRPDPWW